MHGIQKPKAIVVDDEFLIRADIAAIFEDLGYNVIEATDADDAITKIQEGAPPKIVFTDVRMPGAMDGVALARLVTQMYPAVTVIVSSGNRVAHLGLLPPGVTFLPKPVDVRALEATVRNSMPTGG